MTEVAEDRVYARHPRRRGAVLIVGAGAVGGLTAQQLAPMGISPLWLIDRKVLAEDNIVRHPLGAQELGQSKALALAERIHRDFPLCNAIGRQANFLELSSEEQLLYARAADVVVAATDEINCQRRVNEVCLQAERPAVFPAVWVDPRIRDAEVGEILWVLPGRHTPCYECAAAFRQGAADAQAARGARVDTEPLAVATAQVVAAILDPTNERSAILDPERTAIYIHGLTPTSPGIQATFPAGGLQSRSVRVPFPRRRCPACGGQEAQTRPALTPPPRPALTRLPPPTPAEPRSGWFYLRRRLLQYIAGLSVTVVVLLALIGWLLDLLASRPTPKVALNAPTSAQAQASEPPISSVPEQTAAPSSVEATSVAAPSVQAAIEPPGDTQSPTDAPFPKNLSLSCSYSITGPYGDFVPCPKAGNNAVRLWNAGGDNFLLVRLTIVGLSWRTWWHYVGNPDQDYGMDLIGPDNLVMTDLGDGQPTPVETSNKLVYVEGTYGATPIIGDFKVKIYHRGSADTVVELVTHAVR